MFTNWIINCRWIFIAKKFHLIVQNFYVYTTHSLFKKSLFSLLFSFSLSNALVHKWIQKHDTCTLGISQNEYEWCKALTVTKIYLSQIASLSKIEKFTPHWGLLHFVECDKIPHHFHELEFEIRSPVSQKAFSWSFLFSFVFSLPLPWFIHSPIFFFSPLSHRFYIYNLIVRFGFNPWPESALSGSKGDLALPRAQNDEHQFTSWFFSSSSYFSSRLYSPFSFSFSRASLLLRETLQADAFWVHIHHVSVEINPRSASMNLKWIEWNILTRAGTRIDSISSLVLSLSLSLIELMAFPNSIPKNHLTTMDQTSDDMKNF